MTVLFFLASAALAAQTAGGAMGAPAACAVSNSAPTTCAETDNVNVPIFGGVSSYLVAATHPTYSVGVDNCAADETNCAPSTGPSYPFTPGVFQPYNDGFTVFEVDRESSWWRPTGMVVTVDGLAQVSDATYIVLYQKIQDAGQWPQVLVLYEDGYMRLIPQPPVGVLSVCFGASVLIGPAAMADRPFADIRSINYVSGTRTLQIAYAAGGSATVKLIEVDRTTTTVAVTVNYLAARATLATFRSMFVAPGNDDTDAVRWVDTDGVTHDDAILQFAGGAGTDFFFYRGSRSQHNTSAPDIGITMTAASPLVFADGVVNSTSSLSGTAAPGGAASIFGCGIGPENRPGGISIPPACWDLFSSASPHCLMASPRR